jgi:hypothetical protein
MMIVDYCAWVIEKMRKEEYRNRYNELVIKTVETFPSKKKEKRKREDWFFHMSKYQFINRKKKNFFPMYFQCLFGEYCSQGKFRKVLRKSIFWRNPNFRPFMKCKMVCCDVCRKRCFRESRAKKNKKQKKKKKKNKKQKKKKIIVLPCFFPAFFVDVHPSVVLNNKGNFPVSFVKKCLAMFRVFYYTKVYYRNQGSRILSNNCTRVLGSITLTMSTFRVLSKAVL